MVSADILLYVCLASFTESFSREEIIDSSAKAYRFDVETILTHQQSDNIFVEIPFPEEFSWLSSDTASWKQREYLQLIDLFMKNVLGEDISSWKPVSIASTRLCSGEPSELLNFGVNLQKSKYSRKVSC